MNWQPGEMLKTLHTSAHELAEVPDGSVHVIVTSPPSFQCMRPCPVVDGSSVDAKFVEFPHCVPKHFSLTNQLWRNGSSPSGSPVVTQNLSQSLWREHGMRRPGVHIAKSLSCSWI